MRGRLLLGRCAIAKARSGRDGVSALSLQHSGKVDAPGSAPITAVICACLAIFAPSADAKNIVLVPCGSVWKYSAEGTDLGTGWRAANFDDSTWPGGPTELGCGDGGEVTLIPAPPPITTYFRITFDVANPAVFTGLLARLVRDDGAVIYLNGKEIMRSNIASGAVGFDSLAATKTEFRDEGKFFMQRCGRAALRRGRNVLAVEVHQASAGDPDLSFDLELVASSIKPAAFVTRGPYLQNATPSETTIRWRTDVPTQSHVRFEAGTDGQRRVVRAEEITTEHAIRLRGLRPDTQYYYRIGTNAAALEGHDALHWFRTPPAIGTVQPVRIWVLGDCGRGGDGTGRAESVRDGYMRSSLFAHNDVWLMLGDNAYDFGRDEEYQSAVFDTYRSFLRDTLLWSTIGNHETYATSGDPPYFDIFTLPKHGEAGGLPSGTESYYSFDYANIHFVCLDSMRSSRRPGSPMLKWLADDLVSTTQMWIIAFWHHPPYSKGSHDSDVEVELVEMRQNVLPILEDAGVDLVLSGHSHSYERSMLIDGHYGDSSTLTPEMIKDSGDGQADGDGVYAKNFAARAGAVYVVSGTASQVSGGTYDHPVMFTSLPLLGSLILDIQAGSLTARFIGADSQVHDYFTLSK